MKEYLKNIPEQLRDVIGVAQEVSAKLGYRAYLVGGFVRDLLLGVSNFDVDIAVETDGLAFAEELCVRTFAKLTKHRRFGTATLILPNRIKVDISTTRKEEYPYPGALPVVSAGTIEDDLRRRDFSINSMAISISQQDYGRILDFFSAREDLEKRYIRVLHDLSFKDDPTRILRAVRFEQRYNFRIERHTLGLLKKAVREDVLQTVDRQRIRDELILLLKEDRPLRYIKRVHNLVGLGFLHRAIRIGKNKIRLLQAIEKQISFFKRNFPRKRSVDSWLVYLMALLDELNYREVNSVCAKFALRMGEAKRINSYVTKCRFIQQQLSKKIVPASRVFRMLEPLSYEVILLIRAKTKDRLSRKRIDDFLKVYNGIRLHITGEDLKNLGIKPGPYFKHIMTKTLYAKIDHKLIGKDEELLFIRKMFARVKSGFH